MTTILGRYISKVIFTSTGLATLVITGVLYLLTLLGEIKHIGQGDYGVAQALWYVLLRLPKELYQFSPMLSLLGSIIGLSILASSRELSVMRASGFRVRSIIVNALMATMLLTLLLSFIGEWIAPNLSYRAEIRKENEQNAGQAVVTASGVWMHVDDNFIHVRHVIGRQLLEGVTRYQFDDKHHLQAAYFAKMLVFQNGQWQMRDMVKTTFYNDHTTSESAPLAKWTLKFNPSLLNVGLVDPSEMTLPKLKKFAGYLEQNGLQANEYRYEFWQRVFKPFAALIMVFLAIPFVLSVFSARTLGLRIIAGIIIGFIFFISNAFLGQFCIVYQIPVMIAASFPLVIFSCIGLVLSKRLIRH